MAHTDPCDAIELLWQGDRKSSEANKLRKVERNLNGLRPE